MLRRLRRPAAALLLIPVLASCGSDSKEGSASDDKTTSSADASSTATDGLSEVTFEGEVGESLTATWHSEVEAPESTTVTTLVKGTGDEVADGDTVSTYLYLGNGTTQEDAFSDYDNGAPESLPNDGQLGDVFTQLFDGATYGSRVVAVTTPSDLFGASGASGNEQLGIGADDVLVVVADLVEKAAVAPTPTDDEAHEASPDSQPKVEVDGDKVTGLDWTGVDEPDLATPVQRAHPHGGHGCRCEGVGHRDRELLRRDLPGQGALRRELHEDAVDLAAERADPGLEHRADRREGRQPGPAPDPAGVRLRRGGQRRRASPATRRCGS